MNCFVLRVDGVWGVGPMLFTAVTVLGGQVGGAPGLGGGDTARRRCRRGPRRHRRRPALRMRTSRGAELFHVPQRSHLIPICRIC